MVLQRRQQRLARQHEAAAAAGVPVPAPPPHAAQQAQAAPPSPPPQQQGLPQQQGPPARYANGSSSSPSGVLNGYVAPPAAAPAAPAPPAPVPAGANGSAALVPAPANDTRALRAAQREELGAPRKLATVRFWLKFKAEWGQRLKVVGSHEELGKCLAARAVPARHLWQYISRRRRPRAACRPPAAAHALPSRACCRRLDPGKSTGAQVVRGGSVAHDRGAARGWVGAAGADGRRAEGRRARVCAACCGACWPSLTQARPRTSWQRARQRTVGGRCRPPLRLGNRSAFWSQLAGLFLSGCTPRSHPFPRFCCPLCGLLAAERRLQASGQRLAAAGPCRAPFFSLAASSPRRR